MRTASLTPLFVVTLILLSALSAGCVEDQAIQKRERSVNKHVPVSGERRSVAYKLSANATPEATELVGWLWPAAITTCPGFTRYSDDLTAAGSENSAGGEDVSMTVVLKVAEAPHAERLTAYLAQGQSCRYGLVGGSAPHLLIEKSACQSVCLDRDAARGGKEELSLPFAQ